MIPVIKPISIRARIDCLYKALRAVETVSDNASLEGMSLSDQVVLVNSQLQKTPGYEGMCLAARRIPPYDPTNHARELAATLHKEIFNISRKL